AAQALDEEQQEQPDPEQCCGIAGEKPHQICVEPRHPDCTRPGPLPAFCPMDGCMCRRGRPCGAYGGLASFRAGVRVAASLKPSGCCGIDAPGKAADCR